MIKHIFMTTFIGLALYSSNSKCMEKHFQENGAVELIFGGDLTLQICDSFFSLQDLRNFAKTNKATFEKIKPERELIALVKQLDFFNQKRNKGLNEHDFNEINTTLSSTKFSDALCKKIGLMIYQDCNGDVTSYMCDLGHTKKVGDRTSCICVCTKNLAALIINDYNMNAIVMKSYMDNIKRIYESIDGATIFKNPISPLDHFSYFRFDDVIPC